MVGDDGVSHAPPINTGNLLHLRTVIGLLIPWPDQSEINVARFRAHERADHAEQAADDEQGDGGQGKGHDAPSQFM